MNFSNPTPTKATGPAKGNAFKNVMQKLWAGIGMISLMAPGETTRQNIDSKNIGVIVFILIILWLSGCGIYINIQWLSDVRISGEWFYYLGILPAINFALQFFDLEKRIREFCLEKKIIHVHRKSILEKLLGPAYAICEMMLDTVTFLWIVCGVFFYDWKSFLVLVSVSFVMISIERVLTTVNAARKLYFTDSSISFLITCFIILNHIYKFI